MLPLFAQYPIPAVAVAKHVAARFGNVWNDTHILLESSNMMTIVWLKFFGKVVET